MIKTKARGNQLIECMRIVCCVVILCIHTGFPLPPPARSPAVAVSRFAVPFLILLSGWYTDHDGGTEKAKKKLKDTFRVVIFGGSLCIFWNCINSFLKTNSLTSWMRGYMTEETVVNFLLYNRAIFINSVFYYFFIMIYVYVVFITVQRLATTKYIYMLMPLLLAGGIYICEFTELPWYYGGNFLFTGLPVFFLGYILRLYHEQLIRFKSKEWIFITAGVISTLLEHRYLGDHYLYIGAIITSVFLFIFCINHEQMNCPPFFVSAGTFLSLPIIVIHCQVRDSLRIIRDFGPYGLPLLVLACSTVLAIVYNTLKIRGR